MATTVGELVQIRNTISQMDKFNQIEVLKIFTSFPEVCINETLYYGTCINLSNVSAEVIDKLKQYILYVETQEKMLTDRDK